MQKTFGAINIGAKKMVRFVHLATPPFGRITNTTPNWRLALRFFVDQNTTTTKNKALSASIFAWLTWMLGEFLANIQPKQKFKNITIIYGADMSIIDAIGKTPSYAMYMDLTLLPALMWTIGVAAVLKISHVRV